MLGAKTGTLCCSNNRYISHATTDTSVTRLQKQRDELSSCEPLALTTPVQTHMWAEDQSAPYTLGLRQSGCWATPKDSQPRRLGGRSTRQTGSGSSGKGQRGEHCVLSREEKTCGELRESSARCGGTYSRNRAKAGKHTEFVPTREARAAAGGQTRSQSNRRQRQAGRRHLHCDCHRDHRSLIGRQGCAARAE